MVDVGLTHVIVKRLNRWYRSRSRPHGTVDHFYRGIRLSYNTPYRIVSCFTSCFLLSIGCLLYFVPEAFSDPSAIKVMVVKIAWIGIVVVAILAPLEAFRDFVIVNDEGLMNSNLFGRKTRLEWNEISRIQNKLDENEVVFTNDTKCKLKLSLCYDGWQDFLETSAKHLQPPLQFQLELCIARIKKPKA